MGATVELQKAVYSTLSTSVYKVFDSLPSKQAMPFIVIGEDTLLFADTKTEGRSRHVLTIHCWSDKTSSLEVRGMNDFVMQSLFQLEKVNGYHVDFVELELAQVFKSEDKYHGVISIAITLTKL